MVSRTSLAAARKVLRLAPDLVDNIMNGSKFLEPAYKEAKNREQLAQNDDSKLATLREEAGDLADLVATKQMEINEAVAALQERKRKRIEVIEDGKLAAESGLSRFLADVASIIAALSRGSAFVCAFGHCCLPKINSKRRLN